MGNDFMIVIARKDVKKTLAIAKKHKQKAIEAGYIENGEKKVVIHPKNITFDASTLDLR
jgi:phosphoribosylaminoimidazole (AIR) synthetase